MPCESSWIGRALTFALLSPARKASLTSIAKRYHDDLDDRTLAYFARRGLDDQALSTFRIGTVLEPAEGHEIYTGRAVLPYITPTGVVNLKFRCVEDHERCKDHGHEKYYSLSGYGTRLYNVLALTKDSPVIAITEGEIDAISLQYKLDIPTVAYPGATQWRGNPHWPLIFEGYETVYVIADGDKPGQDAAKEVASTMRNAEIVQCQDGEDANSTCLTEGGRKWLAERLGVEL
jgi:DNA primase